MTTLADLTPEERAQCKGMWCEDEDGKLCIYRADHIGRDWLAICIYPDRVGTIAAKFDLITPRYDLPRAWTPDGQPVPGEWEDGYVVVSYDDPDPGILKDAVSIEGLSEGGMSYYDAPPNGIEVKLDKFGEGEGKARRWVGEWEEA